MEIAARHDGPVGQDEGVVGDRVRLDCQRTGHLPQQVEAGTVDLRLAADTIRVLDPLVALEMALADFRTVEQRGERRSRVDLSAMAPQRVDLGMERRRRPHRRVRRQRAGDERGSRRAMRAKQAGECQRGRHLGAVDERDAFLGLKDHRLESRLGQRLARGQSFAGEEGLALAHHRRRHVGERCEVAGRADRSLLRNERNDPARQHVLDELDDVHPHAGRAAAQRQQLQRHHQADDLLREWRADAAAMRQDQVALQGLDVVRRNADACKFAEPGVDAIDRFVAARDAADPGRRLLDAGMAGWVEANRRHLPPETLQVGDGDLSWLQDKRHSISPVMRR